MNGKRAIFVVAVTGLLLSLAPGVSFGAQAGTIDAGDTAFVLISSAMVLFMTVGLALFYGGMVRGKNVLSITLQSFITMALVSLQWVILGYTLSFGPDNGHLIGNLSWLGFRGVGFLANPDYAPTIPHQAFAFFQMMFAIITPALITGAFAERMSFKGFLLFTVLWATLVYNPLAHWVWGVNGWLRNLGVLDFAGGIVVHISAGISGLIAAIYLGKRQGYGKEALLPHNIPMVVLGAGILWFGWFGFNAGSALGANGIAVAAAFNTNTAAAAAALGWMLLEWLTHGKPTALGAVSGSVAGLGAITPASGFVAIPAAIIIGFIAGILCCLAVSSLKKRIGYDDALDVFGCHGIGGIWGTLATGIFATRLVNPAGADGLLAGNPGLLMIQALAVIVVVGFTAIMTFILLKLVDSVLTLRVNAYDEETGLDLSQHGESAYHDNSALGMAFVAQVSNEALIDMTAVKEA